MFKLTRSGARWSETVLYSFCTQTNCSDGQGPVASLITDKAGHLYGTTVYGGQHDGGIVFELLENRARTRWGERVLYRFCARTTCNDGKYPAGSLLLRPPGQLYGTTTFGGRFGQKTHGGTAFLHGGTVFVLTLNAAKTGWTEKVLHNFCLHAPRCADGDEVLAGVIADRAGNLYGTTSDGGVGRMPVGVVFELVPNTAKTGWAERILYNFCSKGLRCTDGDSPNSALIMDASGHLYGTTA
ncbi:MAG: choice-of-anchor tandem repeat GloVer-containing protein, partial [Stellaceae bacterium]